MIILHVPAGLEAVIVRDDDPHPDDLRGEDGMNPSERAAIQALVHTIRRFCRTPEDADAYIEASKGMLGPLRKAAKTTIWNTLSVIKAADPAKVDDPTADVRRHLDSMETVDAIDAAMRAYEGGAAIGDAPAHAQLGPADLQRLMEHAQACRDAIAEREAEKLVA